MTTSNDLAHLLRSVVEETKASGEPRHMNTRWQTTVTPDALLILLDRLELAEHSLWQHKAALERTFEQLAAISDMDENGRGFTECAVCSGKGRNYSFATIKHTSQCPFSALNPQEEL